MDQALLRDELAAEILAVGELGPADLGAGELDVGWVVEALPQVAVGS